MSTPLDIWIWITAPWKGFHRQLPFRVLSRLMAPEDRLYILDRPLDPTSLIRHPERWPGRDAGNESERFQVLQGKTLIHDQVAYRHPRLETLHYKGLKKQFSTFIRAEARQVHWLMHPCFWPALRFFEAHTVIYDCYDEYTETPGHTVPRLIRLYEDMLLRRADTTITASDIVTQRKRARARFLRHIPNPTDTHLFFQARQVQKTAELPADLRRLPEPRVAYVGALKPHLDQPLLLALAQQHPNVSFVMIGSPYANPDLSALEAQPNIHFLGHRPYAGLPAYLAGCQLGLIPYQLDEYTRMLQPNKALEYLAAGLEVVSTDIPGLRQIFPGHLLIGKDIDEFKAAFAKVLQRYPNPLPASALKDYSWEPYLSDLLTAWKDQAT